MPSVPGFGGGVLHSPGVISGRVIPIFDLPAGDLMKRPLKVQRCEITGDRGRHGKNEGA